MKKMWAVLVLVLAVGLMGCSEQRTTTGQAQTPTSTFGLETMVTYYEPYPIAFYNTFYELGEPDITFEIKIRQMVR